LELPVHRVYKVSQDPKAFKASLVLMERRGHKDLKASKV
jgi:hypothetical protein